MAHTSNTIIAPVTYADVNAVLGTAHTDVKALCRDAHINMWAKYKPVVLSKILTTDEWDAANNTWKTTANWYKSTAASNYNCGITLHLSDSNDKFMRVIAKDYADGLTYVKPYGGAESPYRIQDFAGYKHDAKPFIASGKAKGYVYRVNRFLSNSLTINVAYRNVAGELSIADFPNLCASSGGVNDIVLGIAVYNDNPATNESATLLRSSVGTTAIASGGGASVSFSDSETNVYVMLFMMNKSVSRRYALPFDNNNYGIFKVNLYSDITEVMLASMGTMTVMNGNSNVQAGAVTNFNSSSSAMIVKDGYKYRLLLTIQNRKSTQITIGQSSSSSEYYLRINLQNSSFSGELYPIDSAKNNAVTTLTIPANSSKTYMFESVNPFKGFWNGYTISTTTAGLYVTARPHGTTSGDFVIAKAVTIHVKKA